MFLQEFIEHFRVLLRKNATDSREDISLLFQKMGMDPTTYQIGKTKVNMIVVYLIKSNVEMKGICSAVLCGVIKTTYSIVSLLKVMIHYSCSSE